MKTIAWISYRMTLVIAITWIGLSLHRLATNGLQLKRFGPIPIVFLGSELPVKIENPFADHETLQIQGETQISVPAFQAIPVKINDSKELEISITNPSIIVEHP